MGRLPQPARSVLRSPVRLKPGRIHFLRVAGFLHPGRDVTLPVQQTPDIDVV
jgi:hypothetical protein